MPIHGPTTLFGVSTFNEETEQSWLQIWRRKQMRLELGPFSSTVLDLRLVGKNLLCLPDPRTAGMSLCLVSV